MLQVALGDCSPITCHRLTHLADLATRIYTNRELHWCRRCVYYEHMLITTEHLLIVESVKMKKVVVIAGMLALVFSGTALAAQRLNDDSLVSATHLYPASNGAPTELKNAPGPCGGKTANCDPDGSCANGSSVGLKLRYFAHHALDAGVLVNSLFMAGPEMAKPPAHYPREWHDGGLAFGRLYGDALAFQTAAQSGRFIAALAFHENPSYSPSTSPQPLVRAMHAIVFTAFDKSDAGHTIPAFSNFGGAASAGFIGTAYLPRGYNDPRHALDRTMIAFASFAVTNLVSEFRPQLRSLSKRLHLPQFVVQTSGK